MRSEMLRDLSLISDIGIRVVDENGEDQFKSALYEKAAPAVDYLDDLRSTHELSKEVLLSGCEYSIKFGGNYIFMGPSGLTFVVSSLMQDVQTRWFAVGGPMIVMNFDDYVDFEITPYLKEDDKEKALQIIKRIPIKEPAYVSAFAAQLHMNAQFINNRFVASAALINDLAFGYNYSQNLKDRENKGVQEIAYWDSTQFSVRKNLFSSRKLADNHHRLINNLAKENAYQARLLMDTIVEQTLYHTSSSVDFIKARIPEYLTLLFENAISSGADAATIASLRENVLLHLHKLGDLDEIVKWLNEMIEGIDKCLLIDPSSKHASIILRAMEYIREHAAEKITLSNVAGHVYLSPTYLSKLLKNETGQSFTSYLNRIRIEQSKQLMRDYSMSIAEICNQVGFDDQSYFTKVFKKHEGVTPYRYRCEHDSF